MTMRQPRYGDIFAAHDNGAEMAEMARVLWAEYKDDLVDRGLWTVARGRLVDRLVRARTEYENLYPIASSQGPVHESAEGNQYANMLWSQTQKLSEAMLKIETALTLTPSSVSDKGAGNAKTAGLSTGASKYRERSRAN